MRTVWAELREWVSLCRALLMKRACSAIWESPISPSSSAFGISAATCHSDPIINDLTTYLYSKNEYICQNLKIKNLLRTLYRLANNNLASKRVPAQLHRVAQTEGLEYLHQCPLQTAGPLHAPHQQKDRSLKIHITTPWVEGNKCKIRAFHTETISAFTIAISFYILVSNLVPISRTLQGIRWRFNQMYSILTY